VLNSNKGIEVNSARSTTQSSKCIWSMLVLPNGTPYSIRVGTLYKRRYSLKRVTTREC